MLSYYEVLNVSREAEEVVIRAAYRAMMARYHPDTSKADPASAEQSAKLLNEAYATLRDADRRRSYDAWLRKQETAESQSKRQNSSRKAEPQGGAKTKPSGGAKVVAIISAPSNLDQRGFRNVWLVLALPLLAWFALSESRISTSSAEDPATTAIAEEASTSRGDTSVGEDSNWIDVAGTLSENQPEPRQADASASPDLVEAEAPVVPEVRSGNERPDLSDVEEEDRRTIELACVTQDGIVAKNACLRNEAAQLRAGNVRPDFTGISDEDRRTIELACVTADGIVAKNGCLRRQVSYLTPANKRPDLSQISDEDRRTIELACVTEDGIVAKNRCLRQQVRALTGN